MQVNRAQERHRVEGRYQTRRQQRHNQPSQRSGRLSEDEMDTPRPALRQPEDCLQPLIRPVVFEHFLQDDVVVRWGRSEKVSEVGYHEDRAVPVRTVSSL